VTLELALAGVPMVTTYVADKGQAKRWVQYKVKFAALPNIIVDRRWCPRCCRLGADPRPLVAALSSCSMSSCVRAELVGFAEMRSLMEKGAPEAPLSDPAERVLARAPKA
jgi:lipid-A-disaccharide synthase